LEALKKDLDKRRSYQNELKAYKARIKYLEKILGF